MSPFTQEHKDKISDALQGVPKWNVLPHPRGMLGKTHPEETKQKISKTLQESANGGMKGKKHSETTKSKMRQKKISEAYREKMRSAQKARRERENKENL